MGKALNNFGNRGGNVALAAPRVAGTGITTSADLANTFLTMNKEAYEVAADTSSKIRDVFLGIGTHGKLGHKIANTVLSPLVAGGAAIEGAVRSVVQPVVNGVVNTRNTGKNTVTNARRSTFGRVFSKKPISDFSFDRLKTRPLKLKNRISNWQFGKGESKSKESESEGAPAIIPVITKEDPLSKDKEEQKKPEIIEEKKAKEKEVDTLNDKKKDIEKVTETTDNISDIKASLKNSKHGQKVFDKIKNDYPDLSFVVDDSSSIGSVKWSAPKKGTLTIGSKIPSDEKQIAPLNFAKDVEKQKIHLILHELGHIVIKDNEQNKNQKEFLEISNKYIKEGKRLTPVAHLDIYNTSDEQSREDLAEMIALFATKDQDLATYLSKLSSDNKEDEEYRKKFNLAKIDKKESQKLKTAAKTLVSLYTK